MKKLALSGLFVLGLTTMAGAQVSAPAVRITANTVEKTNDGLTTFRGAVRMCVNGVEIFADEMRTTGNGGEIALRGNVTVRVPEGWAAPK